MEPDAVIEAGDEHAVVGDLGRRLRRVGREVVGEVRQPATMQQLIVAERSVDLHPGQRAPGADAGARRRPRAAARTDDRPTGDTARTTSDSGSGTPVSIAMVCRSMRRLGTLERSLEVEDRPDRLAGDHSPGREAATVANAVDLEPNRLGVIAATDEI